MGKIIINWKPGVTKITNLVMEDIKALDKKGFYLLLGGLPYTSKLAYERLEPIFIGASFNQNLRDALLGYPDKDASVKRFLEAHYKMDLLFICGILKQPTSKAISPNTIKKIRRKLIRQIRPVCNEIPTQDKVDIEIEHQGMFDPTTNNRGRV